MKITYDATACSGYVKITDHEVVETFSVSSCLLCDVDSDGMPCGFEFINTTQERLDSFAEALRSQEGILA